MSVLVFASAGLTTSSIVSRLISTTNVLTVKVNLNTVPLWKAGEQVPKSYTLGMLHVLVIQVVQPPVAVNTFDIQNDALLSSFPLSDEMNAELVANLTQYIGSKSIATSSFAWIQVYVCSIVVVLIP